MKHTPGPWKVKYAKQGDKDHCIFPIAVAIEPNICEMITSRSYEECRANAVLIAAAPKLYESLKEMLDYWTKEFPSHYKGSPLWIMYEKARKAVVHAEGR